MHVLKPLKNGGKNIFIEILLSMKYLSKAYRTYVPNCNYWQIMIDITFVPEAKWSFQEAIFLKTAVR